jgi:Ca2+-transporting ATPase
LLGDLVVRKTDGYLLANVGLKMRVNLRIGEASLTGKSVLVGGHTDAQLAEEAPLGCRCHCKPLIAPATSGHGRDVVVETKMHNQNRCVANLKQSTRKHRRRCASRWIN